MTLRVVGISLPDPVRKTNTALVKGDCKVYFSVKVDTNVYTLHQMHHAFVQ